MGNETPGGLAFLSLPGVGAKAWNISTTYLFTGEKQPENGTPRVKRPLFGPGTPEGGTTRGWGAWGLALRYSAIQGIAPGANYLNFYTPGFVPTYSYNTDQVTIGFNWYLNYWVKYPSNPQTFGGVSGSLASGIPGVGITPGGTQYTIPCHHGPIVDQKSGTFCNQAAPGGGCAGAIAPAGLAGMAWNPHTGHLLLANPNSIPITNIGGIDEIDPRLGNPNGPVVINTFVMPNCMASGLVQGPGNNFLVGCADHDGQAFPPNEYVIDGTSGTILTTITNVGGVDEVWYNPGDNRYYLAARDMPTGPVMGVIDAGTNRWLQNVPTNANSHSIAVDSITNHAFVPLQSGGICTTQSSNGCIGVYALQ